MQRGTVGEKGPLAREDGLEDFDDLAEILDDFEEALEDFEENFEDLDDALVFDDFWEAFEMVEVLEGYTISSSSRVRGILAGDSPV